MKEIDEDLVSNEKKIRMREIISILETIKSFRDTQNILITSVRERNKIYKNNPRFKDMEIVRFLDSLLVTIETYDKAITEAYDKLSNLEKYE